MTQEFIVSLRAARKRREELTKEQEEALKAWDEKNLDPIIKSCDHTYPWGEEAMIRDFPYNDIHCRICGRYLPKYS